MNTYDTNEVLYYAKRLDLTIEDLAEFNKVLYLPQPAQCTLTPEAVLEVRASLTQLKVFTDHLIAVAERNTPPRKWWHFLLRK